jgi:hypothetical protein
MKAKLEVRMPWNPRQEEPPLAHAQFCLYLNLGPSRSLAQAASSGGLSLSRLKQLSAKWDWPLRAVAWDQHQFKERCRTELKAQAEAHTRLLKDSEDWQRLARAELNGWVRRRPDGELELARPLKPGEAIRLWHLGCQAERHLRGLQAAVFPAPDPERAREHFSEQIQQAIEEMVALCQREGASYRDRDALGRAFRTVMVSWVVWYVARHPEAGEDPPSRLWPWDLPLREPC